MGEVVGRSVLHRNIADRPIIRFRSQMFAHKWARRVAWFILVALGAMDSGSNPGGPIFRLFHYSKWSLPDFSNPV